jgi:hypothetical protein
MNLLSQEPASQSDYRMISLTQGQFAVVDADDYEWLSKFIWIAQPTTCHQFYALRYVSHGRSIRMHREILGLKRDDCRQGDHINGNTLDNRRSNLRVSTAAENIRNQKIKSSNTSGFKEVNFRKERNRWVASIRVNGKAKRLGAFLTPKEAHVAYCEAARRYFGEFARFE